jgi:hypothetical protein
LFPILKDEKFNDTWHRSFSNQARAQDLSQILDSAYKPTTAEDKELFEEKQKFLYAVLESKVLTDRGKAIVREHEDDFDAQAVYKKLVEHHLRSTKAMIDSSTILSYVTSIRLGTGQWRGSTESFIINWQNQVRLYERQVPASDHFSDGQKRTMLENAVAPIDELRQVKNNADLEKTRTGKPLTYSQYTSLLLSAASAYDEQYKPKLSNRQVLLHEFHDDYDAAQSDDDPFDIDAPVSTIQAFAHNRRLKPPFKPNPTRVRMPRERWLSLSDKDRLAWDQLDDKAKATILGFDERPNAPKRVGQGRNVSYDYIQANSHSFNPGAALDSVDDSPPADETTELRPDYEIADDSETRLINAVTSTGPKLPPGDIRRVLSKSSKRQQSVNMAIVVYNISAHRSSIPQSLVDRGANGGLAGADVRVINRIHRTVDVRGIDNHQLSDIGIGTVGGVVQTSKGPAIAIMHQYALLGKGYSIHSPGQLEWFKNDVNDKSVKTGGLQRIKTLDGYIIPLSIQEGLPRMDMRPFTDAEWESLPHFFLTGESDWDPSVLDHDLQSDEQWADAVSELEADPTTNLFDEFGNYRQRVTIAHAAYFDRLDGNDIQDVIDYSDVPDPEYDWSRSVYGELKELKPTDAPEPLGQFVTLTHYVDANLMHDVVTGRSVTGILHLINKTPIDWYSKKQATVETATYGSEFVAARVCVEQIIELRNTLRYLGVPIRDKSYMFGDNQSVVNSSMRVHAKLHKRHTMLSFHRVREAIASGMVNFFFIPGQINPADILSKHWGYAQVWTQLRAMLFWHGDTGDIDDSDTSDKRGVTRNERD